MRTQNNLNYHGLAYFPLSLQNSPECVPLPYCVEEDMGG